MAPYVCTDSRQMIQSLLDASLVKEGIILATFVLLGFDQCLLGDMVLPTDMRCTHLGTVCYRGGLVASKCELIIYAGDNEMASSMKDAVFVDWRLQSS